MREIIIKEIMWNQSEKLFPGRPHGLKKGPGHPGKTFLSSHFETLVKREKINKVVTKGLNLINNPRMKFACKRLIIYFYALSKFHLANNSYYTQKGILPK